MVRSYMPTARKPITVQFQYVDVDEMRITVSREGFLVKGIASLDGILNRTQATLVDISLDTILGYDTKYESDRFCHFSALIFDGMVLEMGKQMDNYARSNGTSYTSPESVDGPKLPEPYYEYTFSDELRQEVYWEASKRGDGYHVHMTYGVTDYEYDLSPGHIYPPMETWDRWMADIAASASYQVGGRPIDTLEAEMLVKYASLVDLVKQVRHPRKIHGEQNVRKSTH